MATYTDWEKVKTFCDMGRKADIERSRKMSAIMLCSPRTTNNCVYGKEMLPMQLANSEGSVNNQGIKIYTYQVFTTNAYHAAHHVIWRLRSQHDSTMVGAMRKPRVIGLDTDTIIKACVDVNGNEMDCVKNEYMQAMRQYFEINDKSYLPLMCHKHFIPLSYFGNVRLIIESTKLVTDATVEVEYTILTPDPLSPIRAAERQANRVKDHNKWLNDNNNREYYHNIETCEYCSTNRKMPKEFNLNDIEMDECIVSYFPQVKTRIFNHHEFYISSTPALTILTNETENSVLKIKFKSLENTPLATELTFASIRPGIYELQPGNNDTTDFLVRQINKNYFLPRGDYICDKPILCYISANYIMTSSGMSVLRYVI